MRKSNCSLSKPGGRFGMGTEAAGAAMVIIKVQINFFAAGLSKP